MNGTGCPEGFVTDEILFYDNPDGACDMSIAGFIVFAIFTCIAKFILALGHTYLWVSRELKQRKQLRNQQQRQRRRESELMCGRKIPIVPILTWSSWLTFMILFGLLWENVANRDNGFPAFLCGIAWAIFALTSIFYLSKFVHLGHRIAPSAGKWMNTIDQESRLAKFDVMGRISLSLCWVALIGQFIAFCVFGLIYPSNYVVVQVALGFQAWFIIQFLISMLYHIMRIKNAIKKSKATIVSSSPNNAAAGDLDRVTRKLTEQQIAMGSFGVLAAVFFTLISAKVIMAQFFIYMLQIWIDLINALLVLASNFLYIRRKARAEGKFASKAGGGGGGESVIQICHQPCVMEEERIIGGGQTPSSAEVRPSTGEIIRLPTNNDQQQQQQQA